MQDVEKEFETIVGLRLNSYDTLLTAIDTLILSLDGSNLKHYNLRIAVNFCTCRME